MSRRINVHRTALDISRILQAVWFYKHDFYETLTSLTVSSFDLFYILHSGHSLSSKATYNKLVPEKRETTIYFCRYSEDVHRSKCQSLTITRLTHSPFTTQRAGMRCATMTRTNFKCQDVHHHHFQKRQHVSGPAYAYQLARDPQVGNQLLSGLQSQQQQQRRGLSAQLCVCPMEIPL